MILLQKTTNLRIIHERKPWPLLSAVWVLVWGRETHTSSKHSQTVYECPLLIVRLHLCSFHSRLLISWSGVTRDVQVLEQSTKQYSRLKKIRLLPTFRVNPGIWTGKHPNSTNLLQQTTVKPFSLISNTLEGQDTLLLVPLNNTPTQSRHIIAVHLLHCSSPALLFDLKGCSTFSHSRTDTKSRRFSKGPLWNPVKLFN